MQDLTKGKKKNCKFLKTMSTLCEKSYVLKGDKVVPCVMAGKKKKKCVDSKVPEACDLEQECGGGFLESVRSDDADAESEEEEEEDDDNIDTDVKLVETESKSIGKKKRKGFLHNSFVQMGSDLEKGMCFDSEESGGDN